MIVAIAGALLFAAVQQNFANSTFEFGKIKSYEGTLIGEPDPGLIVPSPSNDEGNEHPYILVVLGKHGAERIVHGFVGKRKFDCGDVDSACRGPDDRSSSWLDFRNTSEAAGFTPPAARNLGEFTMQEKIVDSKCFLGVMNPGEGKVHRDCAVRSALAADSARFCNRDDYNGTSRILLLTRTAMFEQKSVP